LNTMRLTTVLSQYEKNLNRTYGTFYKELTKPKEIRMFVMLRMNREFMEYMRVSYPDTPLSQFRTVDTYVRAHGGVETLEDDEDDA